ncbi:solute carrier family 35 member F6-like isoform X1 [Haliotis asinina]|uniref:solute carrier family 35 member F6-like isoform X1 n=1 Tax=Haliotis asinina TaxID=109174 RepID=UPI0035324AB1
MSICSENNIFGFFFVLNGAINSLSQGWAEHTNTTAFTQQKQHAFAHPFFLQCGKFFGELFCLLLYGIVFGRCGSSNTPLTLPQDNAQNRPAPAARPTTAPTRTPANFIQLQEQEPSTWNKFIFVPCALCDLAKTGMLYVGLKLTYNSSYIMLRGSVLFFTSLLSVAFLARNLQTQMWVGIGVSILGMAVIGIRDYIFPPTAKYDAYGIAAGDLLIVMAQIMTATKVVLEQKFVTKHNIHPLLAVGLEGLFGFIITVILLIPFYFIKAGAFSVLPENRLEDPKDAFMQIKSTWQIALAFIGCVVSVAFYFYFGIDFAKKHGAIARMVLDGFASLISWAVFLGLGWQKWHPLQILGFILVVVGILLYSDYVFMPAFNMVRRRYFPMYIRDNNLPIPRPEDMRPLLLDDSPGIQEGREGPGGPPRGNQNVPC